MGLGFGSDVLMLHFLKHGSANSLKSDDGGEVKNCGSGRKYMYNIKSVKYLNEAVKEMPGVKFELLSHFASGLFINGAFTHCCCYLILAALVSDSDSPV